MKDQLNINFIQLFVWSEYESTKVGRKTLTILLKDWIFYVNLVCWTFSKVAFITSKQAVTLLLLGKAMNKQLSLY